MPKNLGTGVVEWAPLDCPSKTHSQESDTKGVGVCSQCEGWELSSGLQSSVSSSSGSRSGHFNANRSDFAPQDRVQRILSHWEDQYTRVILKWGSVGVKSDEYTRIMRHQAIGKKQQEGT
ncbi:hypothetical protein TcCL_NonESM10600 [Trypanosoma cruzi]|nr:hypothetical protein TcCL_NonESM10600 [Trypanosoma cruzi]